VRAWRAAFLVCRLPGRRRLSRVEPRTVRLYLRGGSVKADLRNRILDALESEYMLHWAPQEDISPERERRALARTLLKNAADPHYFPDPSGPVGKMYAAAERNYVVNTAIAKARRD